MTVPARIYSRVLVPLDGSTAAEFAIRFGVDLASKHDAELILLYLQHAPAQTSDAASIDSQGPSLDQLQTYLDKLQREARSLGVPVDGQIVQAHDLAGALLKVIDTERISVLVMSTQGRTGMLRWLFGTAIEKTLSSLPVPLLLVRPMYQKVIVPLDGSRWSETAIPRAAEIARVHDAELILLHVYQSKSGDYAGQWALAGQQEIAEQTFDQVNEALVGMRNRLRIEGVRAQEVILRGGNPAQAICDFVDSEEGISMIVMSTHGRTGIARWLMGSVAQSVIKNARCPVTLVHPDK
jgi:nucleotide-binding universal stress UspA family protein